MIRQNALVSQVPYWVAVLTPGERTFGTRRTDPRIDTVGSSVVTTVSTQWTGSEHPSTDVLLAALAATIGAWQSNRCNSCTSGVLVDVEGPEGLYPVRLPSTGDVAAITAEVSRRIAATPFGGAQYADARTSAESAALIRKPGPQIAFRSPSDESALDDDQPLQHSLTVQCGIVDLDGVTTVEAAFRWNSRVFTRSDVDDVERFWEKTISTFV